MARDDLAPRATREALSVLAVERMEPRDETVVPGGDVERRGDAPDDAREPDGIEPDVRVAARSPGVGEHVE